jgi:hypothetical protein
MNYGCDGSGAETSDALNFLRAYGFYASPLMDYDAVTAIKAIFLGWPLIISGCAARNTFLGIPIPFSYDKCHTWVEDGHLLIQYWAYVGSKLGFYQDVLIHNNWGWGGEKNGFFLAGAFDANSLHNLESNYCEKPGNKCVKSSESRNYQYRVGMSYIAK